MVGGLAPSRVIVDGPHCLKKKHKIHVVRIGAQNNVALGLWVYGCVLAGSVDVCGVREDMVLGK